MSEIDMFGKTDEGLILHAVRIARSKRSPKQYRWLVVMDIFAVGSTLAWNLCRRAGVDPEDKV